MSKKLERIMSKKMYNSLVHFFEYIYNNTRYKLTNISKIF